MKNLIGIISLICVITGCKYSPSGSNYIERSKQVVPIGADLSVSPVFEIDDTLKVFGNIEFNYRFDVGNKQVYELYYWLDEDSLENNWGSQGQILEESHSLNTRYYKDGKHTIHVKLVTSSGRNNIADKLGGEFLISRFELPLWFDNAPVSSVSVTKVEREEGSLQVNWEMYRRPDLARYRVYKISTENNWASINLQSVGIIESREITSVMDPFYIGGTAYYRVDVEAGNWIGTDGYSTGEPFVYTNAYPQFVSADTVSNNQLQIGWTRCKYPANFGRYEVYNQTSNQEWVIDNVNDTTLAYTFSDDGTPQTLILRTVPDENNNFRNVRMDTLYIN